MVRQQQMVLWEKICFIGEAHEKFYYDKKKQIDMIVVNTDRLEKSCDIWKMIGILAPPVAVLGYREPERGEYNRSLMRTCV